MTSYLIMLQTNSNQPFILSSPRLREQIGASFEITLLSHWVEEETKELLRLKELPSSFWVSDSSGKVIIRFRDTDGDPKELAKRLIREVTLRALTDAPGLDVTGVFIEASSGPVDPADLKRLDREFSEYSLNRRAAAARFPQFPFLERGSESALPASASLGDLEFSQESLQPNNFDESSPPIPPIAREASVRIDVAKAAGRRCEGAARKARKGAQTRTRIRSNQACGCVPRRRGVRGCQEHVVVCRSRPY